MRVTTSTSTMMVLSVKDTKDLFVELLEKRGVIPPPNTKLRIVVAEDYLPGTKIQSSGLVVYFESENEV